MDSHAYANKLKELAEFLLSKPEFDTPMGEKYAYIAMYYWGDKEKFLSAVKALGAGAKQWSKDELKYIPSDSDMLQLNIERNKICRLVKEAEYDCEPLLSQLEEAQVGV